MILLSVPLTLLLLRNNLIPLHQSSNFDWSPLNHPGSSTMFFSNPAWTFLLTAAATGAGATDISVSISLYLSVKASSLICKDPSHSDNVFILFVLLELILASRSLHYTCFISQQVTLSHFVHRFVILHLSCKVSSLTLYQM